LRLSPQIFWSLSLPEWRALTTPPQPPSLGRREFSRLLQLYPDHSHE